MEGRSPYGGCRGLPILYLASIPGGIPPGRTVLPAGPGAAGRRGVGGLTCGCGAAHGALIEHLIEPIGEVGEHGVHPREIRALISRFSLTV
jgi:hypothetical protein